MIKSASESIIQARPRSESAIRPTLSQLYLVAASLFGFCRSRIHNRGSAHVIN
jgi:hypothetical protein